MTSPVEHDGSAAARIAASPAKDIPGAEAPAAVPPPGAAPVSAAVETTYKPVAHTLKPSPGASSEPASFALDAGTALPLGVTAASVGEPPGAARSEPTPAAVPDTNREVPVAPEVAVSTAHDRRDTVRTRAVVVPEPAATRSDRPGGSARVRVNDAPANRSIPSAPVDQGAAAAANAQLLDAAFTAFANADTADAQVQQTIPAVQLAPASDLTARAAESALAVDPTAPLTTHVSDDLLVPAEPGVAETTAIHVVTAITATDATTSVAPAGTFVTVGASDVPEKLTKGMPIILSREYATFTNTGPERTMEELQHMGAEELVAYARQFKETNIRVGWQKNFWNILVKYFSDREQEHQIGYVPPQDRPTVILEAGCGGNDMAEILHTFFGGGAFENIISGKFNSNVNYTGYDIFGPAIENAKEKNRIGTFLEADGTNLSGNEGIPEEIDLFVFRHPQTLEIGVDWEKRLSNPTPYMLRGMSILADGYQRLREDGKILITNYYPDEQQFCVAVLKALGCEILVETQSPHANKGDQPEINGEDPLVLIARKVTNTTPVAQLSEATTEAETATLPSHAYPLNIQTAPAAPEAEADSEPPKADLARQARVFLDVMGRMPDPEGEYESYGLNASANGVLTIDEGGIIKIVDVTKLDEEIGDNREAYLITNNRVIEAARSAAGHIEKVFAPNNGSETTGLDAAHTLAFDRLPIGTPQEIENLYNNQFARAFYLAKKLGKGYALTDVNLEVGFMGAALRWDIEDVQGGTIKHFRYLDRNGNVIENPEQSVSPAGVLIEYVMPDGKIRVHEQYSCTFTTMPQHVRDQLDQGGFDALYLRATDRLVIRNNATYRYYLGAVRPGGVLVADEQLDTLMEASSYAFSEINQLQMGLFESWGYARHEYAPDGDKVSILTLTDALREHATITEEEAIPTYAVSRVVSDNSTTVYEAHQEDGKYAIKASRGSLEKEYKIISGIQHPHILPLLRSGRAKLDTSTIPQDWNNGAELDTMVFKYVNGSLDEKLPHLTNAELSTILRQQFEVIQYLHSLGIFHADIKAEHILIEGNDSYLIDFGFAKRADHMEENLAAWYSQQDFWLFMSMLQQIGKSKGIPSFLVITDQDIDTASAESVEQQLRIFENETHEIAMWQDLSELVTQVTGEGAESELQTRLKVHFNNLCAIDRELPHEQRMVTHSQRMANLTEEWTTKAGFTKEQILRIKLGAWSHDLGKGTVEEEAALNPDDRYRYRKIILKPSRLTEDEYTLIGRHAHDGYEIIRSIGLPEDIAEMARDHHAKLDTTFSLAAQIVAIADCTDVAMNKRNYHKDPSFEPRKLRSALAEDKNLMERLKKLDIALFTQAYMRWIAEAAENEKQAMPTYQAIDSIPGGNSIVYVIRQDGNLYAVKASSGNMAEEYEIVSGLQHPHILPVLKTGRAKLDTSTIPQDWNNGAELNTMVFRYINDSLDEKLPHLTNAELSTILRQQFEVIQYLHSVGIMQGDIKPDNILIEGNHSYLIDFGMAERITDMKEDEQEVCKQTDFWQFMSMVRKIGRKKHIKSFSALTDEKVFTATAEAIETLLKQFETQCASTAR